MGMVQRHAAVWGILRGVCCPSLLRGCTARAVRGAGRDGRRHEATKPGDDEQSWAGGSAWTSAKRKTPQGEGFFREIALGLRTPAPSAYRRGGGRG